jgi:SP family arabinose:H+ symporter-like MFS transporter
MLVTPSASNDGPVRSIIPPARVSGVVLRSAIVAALGGLLFGFDTAVIAGTTRDLSQVFSLTPQTLGVTVSSALWGTIMGAVYAGYGADRWGRRDSLRAMAALYLVSAVGCGLAWSWPALLFFRILGGIGIGGSSVLGPMYIAEISPAAWRGRLVGVFQFSLVVGILAAYLSNYVISLQGLGASEWRWQLGVAAIPSLVFFVLLFCIPRSPRWLVKVGRLEEARLVLVKIGEPDVEHELSDIARSVGVEVVNGSQNDRLFSRAHRFPIFLAVSIAAFSQFSGINAVLYYLNDIFGAAGFTRTSAGIQAVVIGVTNLLFTVLAVLLIDKVGRKILLLIGSLGMAATLSGIAFIFATQRYRGLLIWLLVVYIGSFAFSLGAVTWVYISEVFPNAVRAKGQSLGTFTHWVVNAVIAGVFPALATRSGSAPFVFFAFMMVLLFLMVLILYPETKNISLESVDSLVPISLQEN